MLWTWKVGMTIDANFNGTNDTDTNLQFRFSGVSSVADPDLQRGEAGGGGEGASSHSLV